MADRDAPLRLESAYGDLAHEITMDDEAADERIATAPVRGPGALVISIDFELHWGLRDCENVVHGRSRLLGARRAVPAMLAAFEEFDVRATWAIVGLLFAETRREMLARLPATPRTLRSAPSADQALRDVGSNERDDPFHFAPSLIRRIADTAGQEIGTHTFTHYYCLEDGQSVADFAADLRAAVEITRDRIGRVPRSIVFPRNQVNPAYLRACRAAGLRAYRGNRDNWLYRARRTRDESAVRRAMRLTDSYVALSGSNAWPISLEHGDGCPVDVPASRFLRPYAPALRPFEPFRIHRITADMRHAAKHGLVFHLWWHPHDFGLHLAENIDVLRRILRCFSVLRARYGMESFTMHEVAERVISGTGVTASTATP
jgi:peptidoglycan/xylan/chitin deacetylase (PgdA/CDA1 family)